MQDMVCKGRARGGAKCSQRGQNNNAARVTEKQARRLLALVSKGLTLKEAAARSKVVKYGNAWCIARGKSWKHLSVAPRV